MATSGVVLDRTWAHLDYWSRAKLGAIAHLLLGGIVDGRLVGCIVEQPVPGRGAKRPVELIHTS